MLARLRHAASAALPRLLHEQGGALAALQQRAASSHSENTNTFLREVSATSMDIAIAAPIYSAVELLSCSVTVASSACMLAACLPCDCLASSQHRECRQLSHDNLQLRL